EPAKQVKNRITAQPVFCHSVAFMPTNRPLTQLPLSALPLWQCDTSLALSMTVSQSKQYVVILSIKGTKNRINT
ncbi:MAG: hypothetical protein IKJ05_03300, partial [Oscillospiraceae bacterium]|nr:hypothetical protein [Oscillospiraceae bacterium]